MLSRRFAQNAAALPCAVAIAFLTLTAARPAMADEASVARGKYLVGFGGCNDCHTPGYFFGKPDFSKALSGSEVGFEIPKLGVFYGPNLTSDKETGLGGWTDAQIKTALSTGKLPDGRELAPAMPWRSVAGLTPDDLQALVDYLRTVPPVKNKVPGPFGPDQKPTSFVMKVVPPGN
jgi:mono/diheme cytochrome c family protein